MEVRGSVRFHSYLRPGCLLLTLLPGGVADGDEPDVPGKVLVTINGSAVTSADLELACLSRGVSSPPDEPVRRRLLEQLVEERLMRSYLSGRRAEANPVALEAQVERIHGLIRKQGGEPQEVLSRLGFTDETLRETLALPLAWQTHVGRIITETRMKAYFEEHRREFDGTQVRASHILIAVSGDADAADVNLAHQKLTELRRQIESSEVDFASAAKRHSEAPSASLGGDVGFFPFRGIMPASFADAAFATPVGATTGPLRTPAGLHLIMVTEEKPGQLSLEDVRDEVRGRLSQQLWDDLVANERASATIIWASEAP